MHVLALLQEQRISRTLANEEREVIRNAATLLFDASGVLSVAVVLPPRSSLRATAFGAPDEDLRRRLLLWWPLCLESLLRFLRRWLL